MELTMKEKEIWVRRWYPLDHEDPGDAFLEGGVVAHVEQRLVHRQEGALHVAHHEHRPLEPPHPHHRTLHLLLALLDLRPNPSTIISFMCRARSVKVLCFPSSSFSRR
jgi:hypothetical protein